MNRIKNSRQLVFNSSVASEVWQSCSSRQRALLGILATARVHQFDPAPLIEGLAAEHKKVFQLRARRLAERLRSGEHEVDIIDELPGLVPPGGLMALQLAKKEDRLSDFYRAFLRQAREWKPVYTAGENRNWSRLSGLFLKLTFVAFVLVFIAMKILPEFMKILEEFELEAPPVLSTLMASMDIALKLWFIPFLIMLCFAPFFWSLFWQYLRRWRPSLWRTKPSSIQVESRRSLALTTQAGEPVYSGVRTILKSQFFSKFKRRFNKAKIRMESGKGELESLVSSKVISGKEARAIEVSSSQDTRAWMLRWAAKNKQESSRINSTTIVTWIVILGNIFIGVVVFTTAGSVMSTLIHIIRGMG